MIERGFRAGIAAFALCLALAGCAAGKSAPDFTLLDDAGHPWTLSEQRGKPLLLTFGFTHCADTCPATLAKLVHLTTALGDRADAVEIVFVSVDPQRDTPHALRAFLRRFDGARLVGLTGSAQAIDRVEKAYGAWAQRVPGKRARGDYDVAHSAGIYFIDARGALRALHDDDDSESTLSAAVTEMLG